MFVVYHILKSIRIKYINKIECHAVNTLIMETNTKRLTLLLRFIEVALLLIAASIIISFFYLSPYQQKFSLLADRLPNSQRFDSFRSLYKSITYLYVFAAIIPRILFAIVLFYVRKIVKSILDGGVFRADQASMIRKVAYYFLGFACLLLFFNIMVTIASLQKGNMRVFQASLQGLLSIFERYVLTGLIGLSIAEVFISGMKIKEEQDLTI